MSALKEQNLFPIVLWLSWTLALLISVAVVLEAFLFSAGPMGRVPDGAQTSCSSERGYEFVIFLLFVG